jgi:hypothetical protein
LIPHQAFLTNHRHVERRCGGTANELERIVHALRVVGDKALADRLEELG